ncbi:SusC/RagA family TonB-linked outer membrane protein [Reichenbachiella sp. MALMAid0571]|uniref:SusC/RagA family TonB-linked outer membrane protein n=1 Tax=Reichenbachiella sp. MALMAid0571 TaxID=3143939 RepID=UPI0032DEDC0B
MCSILFASGTTNAQKVISVKEVNVNMNIENEGLTSVFDKIRSSYGYKFVYDKKDLDRDLKLNGQYKDDFLYDVLVDISKKSSLGFRQVNNTITVKKLKKPMFNLSAVPMVEIVEDIGISGKVTDETGAALPGVNVVIDGSAQGSVTDLDGNYKITVPGSSTVLVFSFVGYENQQITVGSQMVIDVSLTPDVSALDEVVVTALGIKKAERTLGYSVSEVKGQEIAQTTTVTPIAALQGKAPGVQINTTSGGTYGGARITLRGNATFGKNTQPIFVVDGVAMDNDISGDGGTDWGNQLKNLNPDDFESISVLKGAAATALYGTRALHGVVIVTTKSGAKRKGLGVSFNQSFGIRTVYDEPAFQNDFGYGPVAGMFSNDVTNGRPDGDSHDNQQFAYYEDVNGTFVPSLQHNMSEENAASWGPRFEGQDYIDYDGSMAKWVAQPDNYKKMFETGTIRNTNIAIDGGGENNTFRLSFTNFSDKGVQPMNDFLKNSFSLKGTQDLVKNVITVGAGMKYTGSKMTNPPTGTLQSAWFHDGFPRSYDVDKWRNNYKDVDGGVPYPTGSNKYMYTRKSMSWFSVYENEIERNESQLLADVYVDFNIAKGLSGKINGNINQFDYKNESKNAGTSLNRISNASYSLSHGQKIQSSYGASLTYQKELSQDLKFDASIGATTWTTDASSTGVSTNGGLKVPLWYNLANSYNSVNYSGGQGAKKTINSTYAYLNFDYKSTLYLAITGRNDWSSALTYDTGAGHNSFFYPSASLSWVVNETLAIPESIFTKLRVSYAHVGNDTDPYTLSSGFTPVNLTEDPTLAMYKFENSTAISPNIKPETKKSFEVGLDMRFMNGRARMDVAYYRDNTHDQIIGLNVPTESGITKQLINAGNMQNQGVEIMLEATPIQTKDFSWDMGFAFTHNRDKIIELYPGVNEVLIGGSPNDANSGTGTFAFVGGDYGVLATYQGYKPYDGTNTANHGLPVLSQRNNWSVAYPNGRQNTDSLVSMGNIQPDWYGAFNTTLRYKGFRLYALFDMSFGGEVYSSASRYGLHQGVTESSLPNRDRENGGIVWTSEGMGNNYFGKEYEDGYIPEGVFPDGQTVRFRDADGNTTFRDVGGMTYQEAYDQGLVEPTHWSGYIYRWTSASTGSPLMGVHESNWVVLRELTFSYDLPGSLLSNSFIRTANVSLTGRDLGFLHNSMPDNINPAITSNRAGEGREMGFAPYVRSVTMALRFTF